MGRKGETFTLALLSSEQTFTPLWPLEAPLETKKLGSVAAVPNPGDNGSCSQPETPLPGQPEVGRAWRCWAADPETERALGAAAKLLLTGQA